MKTLQVSIKDQYGNKTIIPENDVAEIFARIARQKTLTKQTITLAKQLGYTVELTNSETINALFK